MLDEDVLLVCDANASYHYFAKNAGISHEAVNLSTGTRVKGAFHVQNVNACHSRLRQWIQRFHGIATHYPGDRSAGLAAGLDQGLLELLGVGATGYGEPG